MKILRKIYATAGKYRGLIAFGTLCVFFYSVAGLAAPMFVRELVSMLTSGITASDTGRVVTIGVMLTGVYLLRGFLRFGYGYYGHKAAWCFVSDTRVRIYNKLQTLSAEYYADKQTGQLLSRMISDTNNFETLIAHAVPEIITNVFTFIGVAVLLVVINPTLALFTSIPLPFVFAGALVFAKKVRPNFRKAQRLTGELSGELVDNLSGLKEIKIFNRYAERTARVEQKSKMHVGALLKSLFMSSVFHPAIEFFTSIGTIIVIVGGGLLAIRQGIEAADIVAFTLYLAMFYAPITNLGRITEELQNAAASGERVFEVLKEEIKVSEKADAMPLKNVRGDVAFSNVDFGYIAGQSVIENVSFDIEAGKSLAIVGPTGVGKSTVISLLLRFYDVLGGAVTVDGVDVRDVTLESLREHLSVVMQDTFLFNGTIEENIAFAKKDATREEVLAAAKKARIHDEISKMPEGYNTLVGERGMRLSGGQKQRLSIARAILRGTPILILDEATASVDIETEQKIQEALVEAGAGRTIITIAHRLSTIKRADKIIVLEDKHVAEVGTHAELIKAGGLYSKLNFMQLTSVE